MGSGEKEWKAFNDRWGELKANQIRWAALINSKSAEEDLGDGATAVEPADNHHAFPTLPTEDKALQPNIYKSATDPLKTITSGEEIILLHKTGVARETTVVW